MLKKQNVLIVFLVAFTFLNFIQSFFTQLANDECYYWMFSQHLDWGYFDHPPVVAAMIAMGYQLFHNELGVRLMTILMMVGAILILWNFIPEDDRKDTKNKVVFIALVLASPLLHIYSFVTTPDVPLIFFSLVFLWIYKQFLANESWKLAFALGLSMALMAYSKYHGALVVFFVLLSNPKLLLNPKLYVAGLLTFLLLIPHFIWQYQHDFVTFQYHLFGRNENFRIESLLMYPVNTLLVLNPFLVSVLFWRLPKLKSIDKFERALKVLFWGFIIFFALSAFKSHVEPHWIAIVIVPTIYFLFKIFKNNTSRYFKIAAIGSIVLMLVARIIIALPLQTKLEFHGGKEYVEAVSEVIGDKPVAFYNSFRPSSRYEFYTGKPAFTLSSVHYRPTQYDLWNYENKYEGKEVAVVLNYKGKGCLTAELSDGETMHYYDMDPFHFYDKLKIEYPDDFTVYKQDSLVTMEIQLTNPYAWDVTLNDEEPVRIFAVFRKNTHVKYKPRVICTMPDVIKSGETIPLTIQFKAHAEPGEYSFLLCVGTDQLVPFFNSKMQDLKVIE